MGSAVSSHASLPAATLDELNWCNKDGVNHCTASLNQHIPQYCGSCWAHGAISAFQDRIKMDRINNGVAGDDIVLSVQHVLNCGSAGSCYGGSGGGTYQWITEIATNTNHIISVTGWGTDATEGKYWLMRNSWGESWGEHGFARVKFGAINIESSCSWAVPKDYTAPEKNNQFACFEDGTNCQSSVDEITV